MMKIYPTMPAPLSAPGDIKNSDKNTFKKPGIKTVGVFSIRNVLSKLSTQYPH